MMNFDETSEFKKDVKRLAKKWRSIPSDIETAKPYIIPLYEEIERDVSVELYRQAYFSGRRAAILTSGLGYEVIKMRLDCEALGTNSKIRLVFVAIKTEEKIIFVELYVKSEKNREDVNRYRRIIDNLERIAI